MTIIQILTIIPVYVMNKNMRTEILAVIIQQSTKLCSELLRLRSHRPKQVEYPQPTIEPVTEPQEVSGKGDIEAKATSVEAGCVPCAIGHLSTCSGLLAESMRFARKDGLATNEVIDRITHCLEELNTMEREDLSPQMIANLPPWEKELAIKALNTSRNMRHTLEAIASVDDLEQASAATTTVRQEIGRAWFKERLAKMPKEEKTKLAEMTIKELEEV